MNISKLFFKRDDEDVSLPVKMVNIVFILLLGVGIFIYSLNKTGYPQRWESILQYKYRFISGFWMTLVISFFSLIFSFIIGMISALSSRSKFLPLHYLSKVYVEAIRSTPLLVQIFVFYYIIATAFKVDNRYFMGILILSLFSGAYISEIIRAGIESIDKNQIETARSLGFTAFQRYVYIIFPQVIKRILPPLAGQLVSLIKDSSLLSVIAVSELTKNVQEVDSINFATIENYVLLALLYMIMTIPVSYISRKLERRFSYEN